MIDLPSILYRKTYDELFIKCSGLNCADICALVALWVVEQGLNNNNPVYIVTISTNDWDHTVCEIKGLGTLDGKNNLYIPNYYYHKEPATNKQINNAKPVFNWYNIQQKTIKVKKWYSYDPKSINNTNLLLFGDYTNFTNKIEMI